LPATREQPAQARVAAPRLGQEQDVVTRLALEMRRERDLSSHDQLDAELFGANVRLHGAVHPVAIGDGHSLEPERMGALHELLRMARALEKAVVALDPERHVFMLRHELSSSVG